MASSLIGQYQVVAINRGTKHGLEAGHVLAIDQKGEVVDDRACNRYGTVLVQGRSEKVHLPRRTRRHAAGVQDLRAHELRPGGRATAPLRVARPRARPHEHFSMNAA